MYSIGAEHRSRVAKKFWNFLKKGSELVPKIDFRGKKRSSFRNAKTPTFPGKAKTEGNSRLF
ncbi:hypothetical protein DLM75_15920 [Leptospira stimsonii]|uniref:Uncharacterized protein n=1 Tax=Leptospira stimsonii TaxID=2202203 RepID=A0A396Z3H5_9LEPT|nr:hypothetical protein DLM75_15920 [Leptospira stimsonii]